MYGKADVLGVPEVIYDVQKLLITGNCRFDCLVVAKARAVEISGLLLTTYS